MNVWLIEDDGFKRDKIRHVLLEHLPFAEISEARSAKSALLMLGGPLPDVVILDMSLPTFDIGPSESGGRPQAFGGVEFLRELDRKGVVVPVVVVTQYEVYESVDERLTHGQLRGRLSEAHSANFVDLVHYETNSEQWKKPFYGALAQALGEVGDSDG